MVDQNTTSDTINVSTDNNETQATGDDAKFITASQLNSAITNRNKSLEKQLVELKDLVFKLQNPNGSEPAKEPSKVAKLEAAFDQMRKEKEAEVQKRLDFEMRNSVKDELTNIGVKPTFVKAVMAQLIDADKMVGYDEDGKLVFHDQFGPIDLKDGLKGWSKTAEAKEFILPRGTHGSGDKKYGSPKSKINQSEDEAKDNLMSLLGLHK